MTAAKLALPSFSFQAIRGKDEFWDEGIRTTADACEPGNKCRSEVCPEHTPPSVYRRFQGRGGGGGPKVLDCRSASSWHYGIGESRCEPFKETFTKRESPFMPIQKLSS